MAPPPPPGPPSAAPHPFVADPLLLGLTLAGMSDEALRGWLRALSVEEGVALLQLVATTPQAAALVERIARLTPTPSTKEPKPPRGFRVPPKPRWEDVQAYADTQERRYAAFRAQVAYDLEVYAGRRTGVFAADLEKIKKGEYDPFWSTALKNDVDLARATAATAPLAIKHQARHAGVRKESQECEDALRDWRRKNALRWADQGAPPLPWCEVGSLLFTGIVAGRVVIAPTDAYCPLRYDPIDPTTCYPDGNRRVVRKYADTVARVAGDYAVSPDKLRKTLGDDGERRLRGLDEVVDVVEYWDPYWRGTWLTDGTVILGVTAHKYYELPIVYQVGALGVPAYLATTTVREETVVRTDGSRERVMVASRDDDPARGIQGTLRGSVQRHMQDEAVHTRLYNLVAGMGEEAVAVYQDEYARVANKKPEVNRGRKKVNRFLKGHEEVLPIGETANPALAAPILAKLARDAATDLRPLASYGATANSQATGNAVETMQEAGRDKDAWIFDTLALFHARVFRLQLILFERWGHLLGEEGERGRLTVPYARSRRMPAGSEPYFDLTPETVRVAGTHIEVDLTDVARKNLAAIAATGATMTQNDQASSWWVMDKLFNFDDPDAMQAEIRLDKMMNDPAMLKIALMADVRTVYTMPDGTMHPRGDWLLRVIEREYGAGRQGGGQPQPGMMPQPGGMPPMGGGAPMMPGTSAVDLTAFNPQVGVGAGRPGLPPGAFPPGPTPLPIGPGGPPLY